MAKPLSPEAVKKKLARMKAARTKPKPAPPSKGVGVKVPFADLVALLGLAQNSAEARSVFAKAGKVSYGQHFVLAYEAGFDMSLGNSPDGKQVTRPLVCLFLFADGVSRHKAFADLPKPYLWGTRAELLKVMPVPNRGFTHAAGKKTKVLPLDDLEVYREEWTQGKLTFSANYATGGRIEHYTLLLRRRPK